MIRRAANTIVEAFVHTADPPAPERANGWVRGSGTAQLHARKYSAARPTIGAKPSLGKNR
jgi:hypothetical protein